MCSFIKCGPVKLPSFSFTSLLKPAEAFDLLLNLKPSSCNVCSSKPVGITKPATFVVSNEAVGKIGNIKADDLGVWEHKGKPIRQFKVSTGSLRGKFMVQNYVKNLETMFISWCVYTTITSRHLLFVVLYFTSQVSNI